MVLYHGSGVVVEEPLYGYGKKGNDYGQGFYCSEDIELAREWACQTPDGGFVNRYEIDEHKLSIFEFDRRDIMSWLAILLSNRIVRYSSPIEKKMAQYVITGFSPDISGYDVIKGYRADDSYFTFVRSFLANTISLEQLGQAMQLGKLGWQICIKSRKGFGMIDFTGAEVVDGDVYYHKRISRDNAARQDLYKILESKISGGIYARDILEKEMTADELRL